MDTCFRWNLPKQSAIIKIFMIWKKNSNNFSMIELPVYSSCSVWPKMQHGRIMLKCVLKDMEFDNMDCIHLAENKDQWHVLLSDAKTLGFCKMQMTSWLAWQLTASQAKTCSMEIISEFISWMKKTVASCNLFALQWFKGYLTILHQCAEQFFTSALQFYYFSSVIHLYTLSLCTVYIIFSITATITNSMI